MDEHNPKHAQGPAQGHDPDDTAGRFAPSHLQMPFLHLEYDAVCGRLLVTSTRGGFVIFHGVPIDAYIGLRFSRAPERYLRERLIGEFSFVCSSACWPRT